MKSNALLLKYMEHPWLFLLVSVLVTLAVKIPHLGLPYFMDESFSYIPAIEEMAHNGPGLLPGTISLYAAKGHPLLFYFLSSTWLKLIANDSITLMRLFALLISLATLFVFHRFARRHTNGLVANAAVLLLTVQPLFLAQASLLLPEVLLFLLFILSFDSFLRGNYGWYALFGSLAMLTKETAAVFMLIFGVTFLVENFHARKEKTFLKNLLLITVPALVYLAFLLLHYLRFGVFFFSEHLDYISLEAPKVLYKFKSASSTLLLAHGRNLLFFLAILALLLTRVRQKKIEYQRFLMISLVLIAATLLFTILNFFTYRYVFPLLGIFLLSCLVLIQQIKTKWLLGNLAFIICILSVSSYYSATKRGQWDADLGYTEYLMVHQQMVSYCEQQQWYDKEFGAGFNLVMAMRDPNTRYLSTGKHFSMHHLPGLHQRNMILFDSTCFPHELPPGDKNKLTLVKRFQYKKHWGEIYRQ